MVKKYSRLRRPVVLAFLVTVVLTRNFYSQAQPTPRPHRQRPASQSHLAEDRSIELTNLSQGWALQSACKAPDGGGEISRSSFDPRSWYRTSVPATVLAAQVASGEFPDPYTGMNLRKIPGMTYPIGKIFAHLPMEKDSPYACSWWYRKEFSAPEKSDSRKVWLHFDGINYRANLWLNGKKFGDAKDVAGAYRVYDFDVTSLVEAGRKNVLAIETFAPTELDLGINWVDWNPAPPDKNMGLWGRVYLSTTGPVTLQHPQVVTHFPGPSLDDADLTVMAELHNATATVVDGSLQFRLAGFNLEQPVRLQPGEGRRVAFTPAQFPQLHFHHPWLWWPAKLGQQSLYNLRARFIARGAVSDAREIRFGIREITSELTGQGARLFRVNRRPILIRGGGWAPDMLLRDSYKRLEAEFAYVLDMNLNTVRLEGKMQNEDFFNLADEKGILVMAGWCCCDHWEEWEKWQLGDLSTAAESLRSQVLRMRSHPSLLVWLNGSDNPPPAPVERAYIQVLKESAWPNPFISSASKTATLVTGNSGVKMNGPYEYVSPAYWYADTNKFGGAWGFNTETSPGPAVPPSESIRKMIPADHLWPIDEVWHYHAGSGEFTTLQVFSRAITAGYGAPTSLDDYATKSQLMTYDGERAMFEAYGRNKYTSTGVIQWMLNNAWPSLIWHLYDYYLVPAGGYFGAKKACEPLHIQYSYDDRSVVVVNNLYQQLVNLSASARLYDLNLKQVFSGDASINVEPDSTQQVLQLPGVPTVNASPVYFLSLNLRDSAGRVISSNFYWLPVKPAVYDWSKTTYVNTPATSYEDFTGLIGLPRVRLEATAEIENKTTVWVKILNPSPNLAFQVHVGIRQSPQGAEIVPVLWSDNYVSLLPGESRVLTARYLGEGLLAAGAELAIDGFNVEPQVQALGVASNLSQAGR